MTADQLYLRMEQLINDKESKILSSKPADQQYLDSYDIRRVCHVVKNECLSQFGEIPSEVEVVCCLAETVVAPDKKSKVALLKQAMGYASGASGIALIVGGIAVALGWTTGMAMWLTTLIIGTAPIAIPLIGVGALLAIVGGYFMFNDDPPALSKKALDALRKGLKEALPQYMKKRGK